ncbi:MAG TPA: TraB/GumN family protein, partial [Kofleriaceae bacterium]|nr:TraB/GumN family protein [Kofleriaceae bacterium]
DAGAEDVAPAAWAALDAAPRFVSELGDLEPDPDAFAELVKLPRGKGLDQLLPADDWYDLRDALRGTIREEELARVRPWYAMTLLTRHATGHAVPGMDVLLADHAHARHLPIDHLETWEEQMPLLAGAVGVADLADAIHARKAMRCQLAATRAAYVDGELAVMEQVFDVDPTGTMLAPRNHRWLPRIEGYLASGGAFVAVGIGHLLGPEGLPALLAADGLRVERAAR